MRKESRELGNLARAQPAPDGGLRYEYLKFKAKPFEYLSLALP